MKSIALFLAVAALLLLAVWAPWYVVFTVFALLAAPFVVVWLGERRRHERQAS